MKKYLKPKYILSLGVFILFLYLMIVNILLTINVFHSVQEIKIEKRMHNQTIDAYDKYLKINPFDSRAYMLSGDAQLNRREDYEQAKKDYQKALFLSPNNKELLIRMARANIMLKDYDSAYFYSDKAVKLFPTEERAYNLRAWINYLKDENLEEALKDVNIAIAYWPAPQFIHTRAAIYNRQGKYSAALDDLNAIIKKYPDSAYAYYEKGCVQIKLKYKKAGLKNIKKALKMERQNKKSAWTEEEAIKMLEKYNQSY